MFLLLSDVCCFRFRHESVRLLQTEVDTIYVAPSLPPMNLSVRACCQLHAGLTALVRARVSEALALLQPYV